MHFCDLVNYGLARRVASHVDDQRPPARPQHAMHLAQRTDRVAEILERGAAHDEVERVGAERQGCGIAFLEVNLDAGAQPRSRGRCGQTSG